MKIIQLHLAGEDLRENVMDDGRSPLGDVSVFVTRRLRRQKRRRSDFKF